MIEKIWLNVSNSVENVGITIVRNDDITAKDIFRIATRCYDIRIINLYQSNATMAIVRTITINFKQLTHLGLGKCNYINNEMIKISPSYR